MEDIKYLKRVLNNWREFCRTHKNIERAIKNIISENEKLREENENLKIELECAESNFLLKMYGK